MTNGENTNSDRLDRIEAIVESNSRAIQAMMEQQATDRLKHEEAMAQMRDIMKRVVETQSGLTRIENKVDRILEKEQE